MVKSFLNKTLQVRLLHFFVYFVIIYARVKVYDVFLSFVERIIMSLYQLF